MWDYCGMERTRRASRRRSREIPALHEEFRKDLRVTGDGDSSTRRSRRPAGSTTSSSWRADVPRRAHREESCGGHFRAEHQTEDGEAHARRRALRPRRAPGSGPAIRARPVLHKEPLEFDNVHLAVRSYK